MAAAVLSPLHRLWRGLPQGPRRRALNGAASLLAPRPDPVPPAARHGIVVGGELGRASGLGEGARLTLAGLRTLGVPAWTAEPRADPAPPGAPLVLHLNQSAIALDMLRLGRAALRGRRVIGVWPWELPVPPPGWTDGFGFVHEVWAPSSFSAAAVTAASPPGFPPVRVVPHPVACDAEPMVPADLQRLGVPPGALVTLVVFSLASSFDRKNPLAAIAAHRAAFGTRPDRVLLMRVGEPGAFPADHARLRDAARNLPNVLFDTSIRPRAEARAILLAADLVLSLHRSEGFGLVPAEAMALGRPVIATAWSGTEDFLRDDWAVRIPARLVPALDGRGVFQSPGAVWAEPEVEAARTAAPELLGPAGLGRAVRALGLQTPGVPA